MSPLKSIEQTNVLQKIQTGLIGLSTALIIGCFHFLWDMNATISRNQVEIQQNAAEISRTENRVDFLEKTAASHADRISKLEFTTQKQ